jgi:hypothetical protein
MNAFSPLAFVGAAEAFVVVLIIAVSTIVPILVVFWFARKLLENSRENTRLRLEVGKLADELERVRKQQSK